MKIGCTLLLLALWMAIATPPAQADSKSLQQVAADAKKIVTQDKIHDLMDWYRKMKDYGMTYQPTLTAPNDLVGKLNESQLRRYAGIKLMDALYAATFQQRQAVAECVHTIEQIQDALDLRSHADLNQYFLHTLKVAANQPEELDVQQLLEQLASDYILELPDMLSTLQTADYLIDGLTGMIIEMDYITGSLWTPENAEKFQEGFRQFPTSGTGNMLLSLLETFGQLEESHRTRDNAPEEWAVIRQIVDLEQGEQSEQLTPEQAEPGWIEAAAKILKIRTSILTPGTN